MDVSLRPHPAFDVHVKLRQVTVHVVDIFKNAYRIINAETLHCE